MENEAPPSNDLPPAGAEEQPLQVPEGDVAPPAVDDGAPAVDDAPAPEGEPEQPSSVSLLDDDLPPSLKAWDEVLDDEGKDAFSVDPSVLDSLPDEAKQVVVNFRRAFHKNSRALAEARTETQRVREEAREELRLAREEREKFAEVFSSPELQKLLGEAAPKEGLDPFSPEGIQAAARGSAADLVKAAFEKIMDASKQRQEAYERQQRITEMEAFVDKNPDFESDELFPTIKALYNKGLDYREAYELAKAKHEVAKNAQRQQQADEARATIQSPRRRGAAVPMPPEDASPEEVLAFLDAHPEAAAALARQKPGW